MKKFTIEELKKNHGPLSSQPYIVVSDDVLDVSQFQHFHPAGRKILLQFTGGVDATEAFFSLHKKEVLKKYLPKLKVGSLEGCSSPSEFPFLDWDEISPIPWTENPHTQGMKMGHYYTQKHDFFRKELRKWLSKEAQQDLDQMEERGGGEKGYPSLEIYKKWGEAGMLAMQIGPGPHLKRIPKGLLGGVVDPDDFDYFHELIVHEERARLLSPGAEDAMITGINVTLPAILNYGTEEMKAEFSTKVLLGEIRLALAVTEPQAGSDIAQLTTIATLQEDGTYLISGVKKWQTNGMFASHFLVLARTGSPSSGRKGLTYFLVPASPQITTKYVPTDYGGIAGTALVIFEDVVATPSCVVGGVGNGFKVCVHSFNHERWTIAAYVISRSRFILEETMKWCNQRKAFGQSLSENGVVRHRLAIAASHLEASHSLLERVTYQMNRLSYREQVQLLSGQIALLKYQATNTSKIVADVCSELFGGRSVTKTGMGRLVERFCRGVMMPSIYGGSSDVMLDYAAREAFKNFSSKAKL